MPRGRKGQAETDCRFLPYTATELFGHHPRLCLATRRPPRLALSGRQRGATSLTHRSVSATGLCFSSVSLPRHKASRSRGRVLTTVTTFPPLDHPLTRTEHPGAPASVRLMGPSASKYTLSPTHVRRTASTNAYPAGALTRGRIASSKSHSRHSSHALQTLHGSAARGSTRTTRAGCPYVPLRGALLDTPR